MKRMNLRNTGFVLACAVTLAMEKSLEEEKIILQDGTIEVMLNQKTHFLADVNDHLLHSDGDMLRYFIDKQRNPA
jgi:hypothetical protein